MAPTVDRSSEDVNQENAELLQHSVPDSAQPSLLERVLTPLAETRERASQGRFSGVIVGHFLGWDDQARPLVHVPDDQEDTPPRVASTSVSLRQTDIGRPAVLMCEHADPERPIILGLLQDGSPSAEPAQAIVDGERLMLNAQQEIVLKCGKASITLTAAGKVILRGEYLLSRSSGVNRIKGGSVQIN